MLRVFCNDRSRTCVAWSCEAAGPHMNISTGRPSSQRTRDSAAATETPLAHSCCRHPYRCRPYPLPRTAPANTTDHARTPAHLPDKPTHTSPNRHQPVRSARRRQQRDMAPRSCPGSHCADTSRTCPLVCVNTSGTHNEIVFDHTRFGGSGSSYPRGPGALRS